MRTWITILGMAVLAEPALAIDFGGAWHALWENSPDEAQPNEKHVQLPAEPHMGQGIYRVTGRGAVPPDATSEAQGRLLAVGAAQLDALQKLATLLEGADIAAESTADQYVQTGHTIEETARAHLRGVRVLETRFGEDGIAEVDLELVLAKAGQEPDFSSLDGYRIRTSDTVVTTTPQLATKQPEEPRIPAEAAENAQGEPGTMPQAAEQFSEPASAPQDSTVQSPVSLEEDLSQEQLYQKSLDSLFDIWSSTLSGVSEGIEQQKDAEDARAQEAPLVQESQVAMTDAGASPEPEAENKQASSPQDVVIGTPQIQQPMTDGSYTDLVIDVRGYSLIPSITPRVITPKGEQIYPFVGGILEKFTPRKEPEVRYLRSLKEAAALPGYGANPLVIRADGVRIPEQTDVVIEKSTLRKLLPLRGSRMAEGEGYVILLID